MKWYLLDLAILTHDGENGLVWVKKLLLWVELGSTKTRKRVRMGLSRNLVNLERTTTVHLHRTTPTIATPQSTNASASITTTAATNQRLRRQHHQLAPPPQPSTTNTALKFFFKIKRSERSQIVLHPLDLNFPNLSFICFPNQSSCTILYGWFFRVSFQQSAFTKNDASTSSAHIFITCSITRCIWVTKCSRTWFQF
ncbi:hypothetical protein QVD17_19610 [Tagetes erecta]|uniref:Uncharacterized protein n=1 Tax=Tagetes erecta TaxID=13708 RepID=A0AAD8KRA3_TARER|nr:hypothetical protein QVD17_19610 [Tagetes erecta]